MYKLLKSFSLAGVAMALATTPAMANAQGQGMPGTASQATPPEAPATGTSDKETTIQSWPENLRTSYEAWSPATQSYFWSLTEPRQEMFWRLTDPDKERLAALPEPQQEAAWAQIEASVKAMDS